MIIPSHPSRHLQIFNQLKPQWRSDCFLWHVDTHKHRGTLQASETLYSHTTQKQAKEFVWLHFSWVRTFSVSKKKVFHWSSLFIRDCREHWDARNTVFKDNKECFWLTAATNRPSTLWRLSLHSFVQLCYFWHCLTCLCYDNIKNTKDNKKTVK